MNANSVKRRSRKLALLLAACLALTGAQAESFRDAPELPEMVILPAGAFSMGARGRPDTEPVHQVTLPAFAIGKHEITQREWRAIMGSSPARFAACDDCPVENVNWYEAAEFARRLSEKTGKTYRLPSEAEWEYACRAGQSHEHCGGDNPDLLAWSGDEYGSPHPVGKKQPNAWGLHDMSGNVWEWTQDCTAASYLGAPTDGSAREGEAGCNSRILRGGSWLDGPQYSRATLRFGFDPKFRAGDFGFRVVRKLD